MVDRFLGIRSDDEGRAPPIDFRGAFREGLSRRLSGRMVGQPLAEIEMRAGLRIQASVDRKIRVSVNIGRKRTSGCVLKHSRASHPASTHISN